MQQSETLPDLTCLKSEKQQIQSSEAQCSLSKMSNKQPNNKLRQAWEDSTSELNAFTTKVDLKCNVMYSLHTQLTAISMHCTVRLQNGIDITLEPNKGTQSNRAHRIARSRFCQRTTSGCCGPKHKNHQASLPAWEERVHTFTAADCLHVRN